MRIDRRLKVSAIAAPTIAALASLRTFGATGTVAVDTVPPDPGNPLWPLPVVLGVVIGLIVLSVLLRPGWRRPIAAILVLVVGAVAAFVLLVGGLFSDFSGNHEIRWQLVVLAGAVVVGGIYAAARIARGGHPSPEVAMPG
jgi:hypothetical protein